MTPSATSPSLPAHAENGTPSPAFDPALAGELEHLVTEDDEPLDCIFTEKQQRLLTESLYSGWPGPGEGRRFLAMSNVGLFPAPKEPPLVPDAMLSFDVSAADDLHAKAGRSYFLWLVKKPPEVVIEIVSDRRGGEDGLKKLDYAGIGVRYYAILDPDELLGAGLLRTFRLRDKGGYEPVAPGGWADLGLGLTLWEGTYEGHHDTWLRWCDVDGQVIPTGAERAERLAAQLRALGINPEA